MTALIAAVARNGTIGRDNALPWRLPEDLRRFKALTMGHAMIMGRRTWESLGRPLPGRRHLVVTHDRGYRADGIQVVHSMPEAMAAAGEDAYVIGGANLYAQALPLVDRLELTEIDADVPGDAFFPAFDRDAWRETAREAHRSAGGLDFAFVTLVRI
ncbi:MAG: dihydrofolate reductase [Rhodocyclaceae bacterium]|nr:dihydrofolate reductase [Rhodocyclaceae bacterium]